MRKMNTGNAHLPIYLDYNATTPVDPAVAEAMLPTLYHQFGNPSSAHAYGQAAAARVAQARNAVAALIGARSDDIVFTGCATEANNLAIVGAARSARTQGRHLITSAIEHPSVAQPFAQLAAEGWDVTVLPVDGTGRVRVDDLARALRADTVLVSIMQANNEVGTVQSIAELARLAHRHGALFHTDAAQSAGKIPVDVDALDVDLLTLAGHKFYAPKGIGALYVRPGTAIAPLMNGAGHERGLRPGTENVSHIVGLGEAARLARERYTSTATRLQSLRDDLHNALLRAIPELRLNGHPVERLPNTLNVSFPGVSGKALLDVVANDVAASTGSACHADEAAPSGVLGFMGIAREQAAGAVRLSVGMMTTDEDIARAARCLSQAYFQLLNRS